MSTAAAKTPSFTLVLVPMADSVAPIARLKAALKLLKRSYRLQCIECIETESTRPVRKGRGR